MQESNTYTKIIVPINNEWCLNQDFSHHNDLQLRIINLNKLYAINFINSK